MSLQSDELKRRTMIFAVNALRLLDRLPQTVGSVAIARQLAKSATSIGANYRGSCNARSRAEFIAKLAVVVEESEESVYWLDLLLSAQLLSREHVAPLRSEAIELRAIFAKSLGTARLNLKLSKSNAQITR